MDELQTVLHRYWKRVWEAETAPGSETARDVELGAKMGLTRSGARAVRVGAPVTVEHLAKLAAIQGKPIVVVLAELLAIAAGDHVPREMQALPSRVAGRAYGVPDVAASINGDAAPPAPAPESDAQQRRPPR